jgi:putative hydrolase of the HAD superfamily
MRYRTVLFDLFGTLVLFKPHEPVLQSARARWRPTMEWLREEVGEELPTIAFDDFVVAMAAVTEDIVRSRPPEHHEVLSQERFRRALARVGVAGEASSEIAQHLSRRHMDYLASTTFMPPEHGALLKTLAARCTIGLVSNFDHAPTARRLLAENEIERFLGVTVISADFGRRKPHPSIFHAALSALGADADEALYVGDTLFDDVAGARAAGMDVVWINPKGAALPEGSAAPTYTVSRLTEIDALLR